MSDLRILVVENRANWQQALEQLLARLGGSPYVDIAATYAAAVRCIQTYAYDLAVVDLALTDTPADLGMRDEQGMQLIDLLRHSPLNQGCGSIVLTGYPSSERMKKAIRDFGAHDFIEKSNFSATDFLRIARAAVFGGRLRRAEARFRERYQLSVFFNSVHLTGTQLSGPDRREHYQATAPIGLDTSGLSASADRLDRVITGRDAGHWRSDARLIGRNIFDVISGDRRIYGDLVAARALAGHFSDLAVEFCGPASGLGIPFELAYDGNEYLALQHIVSRRVDSTFAPMMTRKTQSFATLLKELAQKQEPLRVLLVAANSDENIPAVEDEVATIAELLETMLGQIGIKHAIRILRGSDADFGTVSNEIKNGDHHIFHYAGHSRFATQLPEVSGFVLRDGEDLRTLSASDLNLLVRGQQLYLVFISGCVGAQSSEDAGRGDFLGLMDALTRADVPFVVGYRWTVKDSAARELAEAFYRGLLRTLSPGEAVLDARQQAAQGENGRDEDSWASIILVAQNG